MTFKEAILQALKDIGGLANYKEVYEYIEKHNLRDFGDAKTPDSTIGSQLWYFIKNGDNRVKRIKKGKVYYYYLARLESDIGVDTLMKEVESQESLPSASTEKRYQERDLHLLLSSYLISSGVMSKTIFHEQSKNGKDSKQMWTHPDMVGVTFLNLQNKVSQRFLRSLNRIDTLKLSSYEIKKEINTDAELKKAYFQAVSNSSWANYGYLVAFEISDQLRDEMERLNQSFGIGVILLNSNPYQSKTLLPATFHELDFKTIDKLTEMNAEFQKFIDHTEKLMTADDRYLKGAKTEFEKICDGYLETDAEIAQYCQDKGIPFEAEEDELI